jgi:hypothetical protein
MFLGQPSVILYHCRLVFKTYTISTTDRLILTQTNSDVASGSKNKMQSS